MEKNKLSQRFSGALMILLVCFIVVFSINFSSAAEWDNVYDYDEETKTATIENWLGLGPDLAYITLTSPQNVMVARGVDQLVGEFNFTTTGDFVDTFGDIYLTDLKNGNTISRGKQFKYKKYKEVSVDDYGWVDCENITTGNGTIQDCTWEEIGSHMEIQMEWIPITNPTNTFHEGVTYEIGVFVDVERGDYGDWIPSIMGVEIEEWATWTEALNVGLVSYYKLDEQDTSGSGTIIDSLGLNNGTNNGADNSTGKIKSAYDFVTSNTDFIDLGTGLNVPGTAMTMNVWIKKDNIEDQFAILSNRDGSTANYRFFSRPDTGDLGLEFTFYNGGWRTHASGMEILDTDWHMASFVMDGTNVLFYLDGSNDANLSTSWALINTGATALMGQDGTSAAYANGTIDELGMWNRSLSAAEINQLWNGGTGISYTDVFGIAPSVTLTSPVDNANLTSANVEFIATVTDDIQVSNVTLYLDGVANETNSSGFNGTYTFSKIISEGIHNWSILAIDNQSFSNQSETRILNYTQPPIFIDLLSPADSSTHIVPLVNMSCKAYIDAGITQLNLTIDGITNISITNSSIAQNLTISQEMNFSEGNYTWGCSAINPDTSAISSNRTFEVLYSSPVINLFNPENDSSVLIENATFIFNASDVNGISNVTLFIDGVLNETNSSGVEGNYSFLKTFTDGNYNWSVRAISIFGKITNSVTRIFTLHTTEPVVNISAPSGVLGYFLLGNNETLIYNISESGQNLTEHLDTCWYDYPTTNNLTTSAFSTGTYWNFINGTMSNSTGNNFIRTDTVLPSGNSILAVNSATNNLFISGFTQNIPNCNNVSYGSANTVYSNATIGYYSCIKNNYNFKYLIRQDDFNDGETDFTSYELSKIINCTNNQTGFTYIEGANIITTFGNDSFGFSANDTSSWSYNLTEVTQTYPTTALETATETYTANVSYNSTNYGVITGTLTLNGIEYSGARTGTGDSAVFSANAIMPGIAVETNFTSYWTIALTDASGITSYNLSSNNVTVSIINMSLCGSPYNVSFWNFTILNESNEVEINSTFEATFTAKLTGSTTTSGFSYSDTTGTNSQFDFCMSPATESYTFTTDIKLTKSGFVDKFYDYEEVVVTNATREDNLYMLANEDSTSYIVHVVYVDSSDVVGAEVRVQRYYEGSGEWLTTEIITTNDVGEAVGHLLSEDANYRFRVYLSGVSVLNSSSTKITCSVTPCTVTLTIPIGVASGTEIVEDLTSTLVFSSSSNIFTYTYSDTSGGFSQARLYIALSAPSNATIIAPCNETKTTASGVITCDISGLTNGTYIASGYITRDADEFLDKRIYAAIGSNIYNSMGLDGVLWGFFILIGIIMLGAYRPSLSIIFGTIGLIFLSLLKIINIGTLSIVAISAIAVILLMRVGRE